MFLSKNSMFLILSIFIGYAYGMDDMEERLRDVQDVSMTQEENMTEQQKRQNAAVKYGKDWNVFMNDKIQTSVDWFHEDAKYLTVEHKEKLVRFYYNEITKRAHDKGDDQLFLARLELLKYKTIFCMGTTLEDLLVDTKNKKESSMMAYFQNKIMPAGFVLLLLGGFCVGYPAFLNSISKT